jgi:hypothetical protein
MMENIYAEKNKMLFALCLILTGVILRITVNLLLPSSPSIYITINGITQPMFMMDLFFVVAVISLLSGLILGGYYTFIVPIATMVISDLILGNNWILLFTWSGFIIIGLIGYILKIKNYLKIKRTPTILGAGIGGILFYDLWTNFGTWLGGWYPHTVDGLILCYTYALPFMFWHLLSTAIALIVVIIPLAYLKENRLLKDDGLINQFEKRTTIGFSLFLMILAIIAVIV